jgi:hypothetical protein
MEPIQEGIVGKFIKQILALPARALAYLFGANWRTSFYGLLALLPQLAKPVQDYLEAQKVSATVLNIVSLVFAAICVLSAKDAQVTGGTIQNNTDAEK